MAFLTCAHTAGDLRAWQSWVATLYVLCMFAWCSGAASSHEAAPCVYVCGSGLAGRCYFVTCRWMGGLFGNVSLGVLVPCN